LIEFATTRHDVDFKILTYTPSVGDSIGDDSFYALWITSPDIIGNDDVLPQDIVFTADVSSSMEGERLAQVKEAMNSFIDLLNPQDKFNIITFGTFVEQFMPDLIEATEENKQSARNYVSNLYALGLTNIDDALTVSLKQSFGAESHNSLIFLTDGDPTWGQTNLDSIVNRSKRNNTVGASLFSFGIGEDISRTLLERVSNENHGYATFIANDDSIALVVNNLFTRISKPVLTDINIDLGGLDSWDSYPKNISDLFWGSQILYLGKYRNSGMFNVTLSGKVKDGSYNYASDVNFPDTTGGHRFVPRLWARAKINYLLAQIELYGEQQELVQQVIDLSIMFEILTPYTAFYADPDLTAVENDELIVKDFTLEQNYPNPFNPATTISYSLPKNNGTYNVTLKIYNSLGELIKVLVNTSQAHGTYKVVWNGKDINGHDAPSGIYFYTLEADDLRISKKMMLLR
jgi:Ca-activated chloride channel family protein